METNDCLKALKKVMKRPKDMINKSNLGKWMSWSDIKKTYPDRGQIDEDVIRTIELKEDEVLIGSFTVFAKDAEIIRSLRNEVGINR